MLKLENARQLSILTDEVSIIVVDGGIKVGVGSDNKFKANKIEIMKV